MEFFVVFIAFIVISPGFTQKTKSFPGSTFCINRADGLYPDPFSCKRFIHCHQSGQTAVKLCPRGTRFDPNIKVCNWARNVKCNNRPKPLTVASEPQSVTVTAINSTTVLVQWTLPIKYSYPMHSYQITITRTASTYSTNYSVDPTMMSYMVTGLLPGSKYTIEIKAVDSVGFGKPATGVVTTPFDIPPAPIGLSARAMGPTAISLQWKDPKLNNDSVLKYIITYGIAGVPIGQLSQHLHGYANTAVISKLIPGIEYEVKVQALTFGGFGAPSIVRVRTTTGDLCPPGHHSKTGKKPCHRCGYGSYQSAIGKQTCVKCPRGTTTLHQGANSKLQCQNVNVG